MVMTAQRADDPARSFLTNPAPQQTGFTDELMESSLNLISKLTIIPHGRYPFVGYLSVGADPESDSARCPSQWEGLLKPFT